MLIMYFKWQDTGSNVGLPPPSSPVPLWSAWPKPTVLAFLVPFAPFLRMHRASKRGPRV